MQPPQCLLWCEAAAALCFLFVPPLYHRFFFFFPLCFHTAIASLVVLTKAIHQYVAFFYRLIRCFPSFQRAFLFQLFFSLVTLQ